MQAGFAFLEAGSVRSKNTTNILIKNALDSCKYKTPKNKQTNKLKKTSLYQCHLMIAHECVQFSFRTFVVGTATMHMHLQK